MLMSGGLHSHKESIVIFILLSKIYFSFFKFANVAISNKILL